MTPACVPPTILERTFHPQSQFEFVSATAVSMHRKDAAGRAEFEVKATMISFPILRCKVVPMPQNAVASLS